MQKLIVTLDGLGGSRKSCGTSANVETSSFQGREVGFSPETEEGMLVTCFHHEPSQYFLVENEFAFFRLWITNVSLKILALVKVNMKACESALY